MILIRADIPSDSCPYVYYDSGNPIEDCNDVSCRECKRNFFDNMRKDIEKEVMTL